MAHARVTQTTPAHEVFDPLHDYTTKPGFPNRVLDPIMGTVFGWETQKRMRAPRTYRERRPVPEGDASPDQPELPRERRSARPGGRPPARLYGLRGRLG